jgi:uncharacterized membrane protein YbhN (UPF0104 family)
MTSFDWPITRIGPWQILDMSLILNSFLRYFMFLGENWKIIVHSIYSVSMRFIVVGSGWRLSEVAK